MDIPCAPILADITINGRTVKAVAQPTKQGVLYVFNRVTGEPIWPIEERPVPKGDVPGEWYSPTQPFPTKPAPYERTSVSADDLIDFTPELRAEALELVKKYKMGPMFTPPVVSKVEGPLALLTRALAGTNWKGGSYDPELHLAFVYSTGAIGSMGLVPPPAGFSEMRYISGNAVSGARLTGGSGSSAGGGRSIAGGNAGAAAAAAAEGAGAEAGGGGLTVRGLPLGKPPYGRISAIDLDKGEIKWQIAHGETPDNVKNHPALKGLDIPRTGQGGMAATLVTKTLLISGEPRAGVTATGARGAMLRAYDKTTGKDIGAVYMPAPESGAPMTYMFNGKQYIVLAISGGSYSGELIAFRLPD
jgi:quinoprotein glucose dehydrogenase